jgi:hypothetical protein
VTTPPVSTPPNSMPLGRNAVYRVGRCYMPSWQATAPVLDTAGELLDAWCVTADQHGVNMDIFSAAGEWVDRLAVIALEMTCRNGHEPRPATPEQAIALLDAVVTRLAERGVKTQRRELDVLFLVRTPFPSRARRGRARLRSPSTSNTAGCW